MSNSDSVATRHPLYRQWKGMRRRCHDSRRPEYQRYGGRGITVCDRWSEPRTGFWNFVADMGPKPTAGHTIDRRDGNGNYEPDNCRWATTAEQNRNSRAATLTAGKVGIIRAMLATGLTQARIGQMYGVAQNTVSVIYTRHRWKDISAATVIPLAKDAPGEDTQ